MLDAPDFAVARLATVHHAERAGRFRGGQLVPERRARRAASLHSGQSGTAAGLQRRCPRRRASGG
eukprot:12941785-Alexandrium_andersonii.AAC.1